MKNFNNAKITSIMLFLFLVFFGRLAYSQPSPVVLGCACTGTCSGGYSFTNYLTTCDVSIRWVITDLNTTPPTDCNFSVNTIVTANSSACIIPCSDFCGLGPWNVTIVINTVGGASASGLSNTIDHNFNYSGTTGVQTFPTAPACYGTAPPQYNLSVVNGCGAKIQ
jgi:hypothetical protein